MATKSVKYVDALKDVICLFRKGKSNEKVFKKLRHEYNVNSDKQILNLMKNAREYV